MHLPPIEPIADPTSLPPPPEAHADEPTAQGFEAWFAQALNDKASPAPALLHGPADFGLWGVSPDVSGRLDLEEVANNLRATLPAFASNLGKVCRAGGISFPPQLRLEGSVEIQPTLPSDARSSAVQQMLDDWPGLARQFRRLMAGFSFTRCSDALRAYQRAIGRLGPNHLATTLGQQDPNHASPPLSLLFDGLYAWPEEAQGERWRPLAGLEQLSREILEHNAIQPGTSWEQPLPIEQAFDQANVRLRTAHQR
ncbi:hypothetical protein [Chitinimonas sp. BJB300]|uniref:hypothetical protein n=1 Tax=Chitinimonas sp. BJB300 TaxID=1559339 RepID=UPI000C0DFFCF|nr:hypothetical protein [Chitinimonas sp. BJB300]PHV13257.1 hypothetical protein CSQ89_01715 [Chitinimonas sp. BJB300]TSJ89650.1 hypothetical protein FG002_005345 [Chitinimonas sp. BJB300]